MPARIFGNIPGVSEGAVFESRAALSQSGVHPPTQAGISGSEEDGADSIVLSGGYEDDEDRGDQVIYIGHGGRDPNTGRQIRDQEFARGNKALAKSKIDGLPIRVTRGSDLHSPYAPRSGYRYDGLYAVDDAWQETGRSGFKVWRYRLRKIDDRALPPRQPEAPVEVQPPSRVPTTIQLIVRDTQKAREVKQLYEFGCQVCGMRLDTPAGPYAEAAHIRPLGAPHNGPDVKENIICLCPNHHVLFDSGAITFADDFAVLGLERGKLRLRHELGAEYVRYHREHYGSLVGKLHSRAGHESA